MARRYFMRENEASRAVSTHHAESNPLLLAYAKMAEAAFCLLFDLDPIASLNWQQKPDHYDLLYCGKRFDLKHTRQGKYLIWPMGKNHLFGSKQFDALALVVGVPESGFTVKGWITKTGFAKHREIAGPGHDLAAGTWCMHEDSLWSLYAIEWAEGCEA